jgi:putative flippase GtrA
MTIVASYAMFALIATVANITAQDLFIRAYQGPYDIFLSVVLGTGVGLVVKYVLDKRYIFRFRPKNAAHDGRTFVLYTVMGLVTTVIFWGFEFGFHLMSEHKGIRYLGGAIGLGIGYWIKYHLDKRYVFRSEPA